MSTTTTTREFSLEGRALADLQQQLSAARVAAFEAKSVADFWQAVIDLGPVQTAPAGAERTHLMDACKDSAGWAPCLFDLTPPEAWQHWRNIAHDQATELTAAQAEVARLTAAQQVVLDRRQEVLALRAEVARLREAPAYADYYAACQCGHALNIHATSHGHPCRVEQCECRSYVNAALAAGEEANRGE
jgi:hypothetical protein